MKTYTNAEVAEAKAWLKGWQSGPKARSPYKKWTTHNAWMRGRAARELDDAGNAGPGVVWALAAYSRRAGVDWGLG